MPAGKQTQSGHQHTLPGPRNVARAVVLKHGEIFLLCEPGSQLPAASNDGFGLYYHDCRYMNRYEVQISGTRPTLLAATTVSGSEVRFELTNDKLGSDKHAVAPQTFGITLDRSLHHHGLALQDVYTIRNYDVQQHSLELSLHFDSCFEDIFEIRGLHPHKKGRENHPKWKNGALVFSYQGADGIERSLKVQTHPEPDRKSGRQLHYSLKLKPEQSCEIRIQMHVLEGKQRSGTPPQIMKTLASDNEREPDCKVQSDSKVLNDVMARSLLDIRMLSSSLDGCEYISAGLPWYGALFGRDSITVALQALAFDTRIAEQTIELLAKYQGTKNDDWRDEEPGKILHELRRGELAHLNEIPQTPYYGSVDSTPLFLILIGQHAQWTGDLTLFNKLRSNVERALEWIETHGHRKNPLYLAYSSRSKKGLSNQGWKDSGDSIMNADGSLAEPPIALVEVQGYVYYARLLMSDLYVRAGDHARARHLQQKAAELKEHFNRDFWVDDMEFYAIALEKHGRPASVISSNPGQALWTGIVDDKKAPAVVRRLMADDMFTGWGIRTLSARERRFNPVGYHLGTVWPHDNSIIMAGLRRYGFDREAGLVKKGILEAGEHFPHYRLREVFAGFSREAFSVPVHYPVACHPQAWAAGAVPFMLTNILGISVDGFSKRVRVVRPVLPNGIHELELRDVKVGEAAVSLHFSAIREGSVRVEVTENTGDVEVDVETSLPKAA